MQPIYIPHTYITDETFQALSACFKKITVYQPTLRHLPESMVKWQNAGQLEIRCPVQELEKDIESSLKSYRYLGEMHLGQKGELRNLPPSGIPFFDDTSPHKIRADIVREMEGNERRNIRSPQLTSQLVQAGLFLQMAQDFDAHQDGIRRDMAACAEMEKNLFKTLKADDDPLFEELSLPTSPPADSIGEHRLKERFSAWTRLFFHDVLNHSDGGIWPPLPLLFITSSRFLFDETVTQGTNDTVIVSLESGRLIRSSFLSALTQMAQSTNSASVRETAVPFQNDTSATVKIAVVFNEPPISFLAKHSGIAPGDIPNLPGQELQPNTLIGLVAK